MHKCDAFACAIQWALFYAWPGRGAVVLRETGESKTLILRAAVGTKTYAHKHTSMRGGLKGDCLVLSDHFIKIQRDWYWNLRNSVKYLKLQRYLSVRNLRFLKLFDYFKATLCIFVSLRPVLTLTVGQFRFAMVQLFILGFGYYSVPETIQNYLK